MVSAIFIDFHLFYFLSRIIPVINNIQQMWYKKELFILKHSSQTFPITLWQILSIISIWTFLSPVRLALAACPLYMYHSIKRDRVMISWFVWNRINGVLMILAMSSAVFCNISDILSLTCCPVQTNVKKKICISHDYLFCI